MHTECTIRKARPGDGAAIAQLIAEFAAEALMLRRTPEMVELAIDDYVVATNGRDRIVGCGALKEYSPSVAEVAAARLLEPVARLRVPLLRPLACHKECFRAPRLSASFCDCEHLLRAQHR